MDALIAELISGPKSEDPALQLTWLTKVRDFCKNAPEPQIQQIAQPLERAVAAFGKWKGATKSEQGELEREVAGNLFVAQGLGLHAYLLELDKAHKVLQTEATRHKAGTENRKKLDQLVAAYEQTIAALSRVYEGMRQGRTDELAKVAPALENARRVAQALRPFA